ncbi:MAG: adenine phosphoribosyltransferase, partial [Kiritimatiellae bacterium]|nr:adenine phosphoribosyltransferase [Kiritimatiellia bacterium]
MTHELEKYIKSIPDFPIKGILFRDVTGILDSAEGFQLALDELQKSLAGVNVDKIAAPESRGFIFGAALADRLKVPFVPIRKPGKLPRETISESYALEYGEAALHIHSDAVAKGEKV